MDEGKKRFVEEEALKILDNLQENSAAIWGKMNAQQMVEHMKGFFDVSTQKLKFDLVTPEEQLPAYKAFLLSDKAFRENTAAPLSVIGPDTLPVHYANLEVAKEKLRKSILEFKNQFSETKDLTTLHPVFGWLNYDEWILLHYKHLQHHLKQFSLLS